MAFRDRELFSEIDKLHAVLLNNIDGATDYRVEEEISSREVLARIENVILGIVTSLSKDKAPVLALPNRSSWANVSFDSAVGLQMSSGSSVTTIRSDCASSVTKFAQILKILMIVYRLVQSNSFSTKRDIYYNNTQLFGSQRSVDSIVDDISCMLRLPRRPLHVLATSKGLISGDLCYMEEDGTRIDCRSSSAAVAVSSNITGIRNISSSAKFILVVEKDATFQKLLDDDFCTRLSPCIVITSMSFEAHSLTVPSVMWLGLLPSDLQRLRVPEDALIPLTRKDQSKLDSLFKRPYLSSQPDWQREMELMQQRKVKAEIQSLAAIAPDFLTSIYLPNKLRYGGWV